MLSALGLHLVEEFGSVRSSHDLQFFSDVAWFLSKGYYK
jgi:hypothetical protein